ncbi:MAG: response regulator [Pyrinomonadaceae bacterium]
MDQTVSIHVANALPKILLVEDFDDTRLMMKMWLVKIGYRVIEAETGEQAIILAQSERPDLILMDIMMPGMNGLDATQRIRQDGALSRTPIVAVSAYGAEKYRSLALEAGCNDYVSTPFEPATLADLISALLQVEESAHSNAPATNLNH